MRLFVQSNLQQSENGNFKWSFNINNIYDAMDNIREFSILPYNNDNNNDNNKTYNRPTLVLKGSKSNFVRSFHVSEIEKQFPLFHLVSVKDAGSNNTTITIIIVNNNSK